MRSFSDWYIDVCESVASKSFETLLHVSSEWVREYPAHYLPPYFVGFAHLKSGDAASAITMLRKSLDCVREVTNRWEEIRKPRSDVLHLLSAALYRHGSVDESQSALNDAIRLHPEHETLYIDLTLISVSKGNLWGGIAALNGAFRRHGSSVHVLALWAVIARKMGNLEGFKKTRQQALKVSEDAVAKFDELARSEALLVEPFSKLLLEGRGN